MEVLAELIGIHYPAICVSAKTGAGLGLIGSLLFQGLGIVRVYTKVPGRPPDMGRPFTVFAGEHAPYIWMRTPDGLSSWDFFDKLLESCHVIGTPGSGFGPSGEGYFRLSAFNSHENVEDAISRITRAFGS